MQTQNGQNVRPKSKRDDTSGDTRQVSKKIKTKLFPAQLELLEFVNFLDTPALIRSLEWVHDTACYHSHGPIDQDGKFYLFNVKVLVEKLEGVVREG